MNGREKDNDTTNNIESFLLKVDWLCWVYGCEILPNPKNHSRPEGVCPTLIVKDSDTSKEYVYIDGDGFTDIKPKTTEDEISELFEKMTSLQRITVMGRFCGKCGNRNPCMCVQKGGSV